MGLWTQFCSPNYQEKYGLQSLPKHRSCTIRYVQEYYRVQKYLGVIMIVDKSKCVGCGMCVNSCPVEAISFGQDGCAFIDMKKCINCGTCKRVCPVEAINEK